MSAEQHGLLRDSAQEGQIAPLIPLIPPILPIPLIPLIAWRSATVGHDHKGSGPEIHVRTRFPIDRLRS
ncbi:hypothetical protein ACH4SK_31255 [Streptomyces inhibens]|uniref:hypothetical protein n=1 Tax=Streptomyces inhibens TaxID=2293571 RepID=UPI00378B5A67